MILIKYLMHIIHMNQRFHVYLIMKMISLKQHKINQKLFISKNKLTNHSMNKNITLNFKKINVKEAQNLNTFNNKMDKDHLYATREI